MITKRTKIMLGVLVVVALGAYAYLYWWSRTPDHGVFDTFPVVHDLSNKASDAVIRPAPAPVTTPDDEQGPSSPSSVSYRTYENTEFGFSFDYPEAWDVSQNAVEGRTMLCLNEKGGTGGCLVTVTIEKEGVNMNTDIALSALRAEFRNGRVAESSRRIGGEEAALFRVSGYPAGQEDSTRAAVFVHEMQVYGMQSAAGQEAAFDRAVSSFRFQD